MDGLLAIAAVERFIGWLVTIVFFIVLLYAVRRIRAESILINLRLRTLNTILREVHKDALPEASCPKCKTVAPYGQNLCKKCGLNLTW